MKFIVSSEILLKKLQLIGGVLNASNTLPILDDFLFEIKKGELTITASDLETTMVTTISIEAKEDGVIAIPAKLLLDTLKTFPDQPLTFTIDKENFGINVKKCLNNKKIEDHVLEDRINAVKKFKINSTPTIIINDKKFEKPLNYKNLKKSIEKLI